MMNVGDCVKSMVMLTMMQMIRYWVVDGVFDEYIDEILMMWL